MKYLVHWKIEKKDLDAVIERFMKIPERPNPEKYPKTVAGPYYFHNKMEGFTIYEVDNEEQIINYHIYWIDLMDTSWKSISESMDFIKTYKK